MRELSLTHGPLVPTLDLSTSANTRESTQGPLQWCLLEYVLHRFRDRDYSITLTPREPYVQRLENTGYIARSPGVRLHWYPPP